MTKSITASTLQITDVVIKNLNAAEYNPRKWTPEQERQLTESLTRFGFIDPIIVNEHPERKNVVIGGHFRLHIAKKLKRKKIPAVFVNLPYDKEKELNLRLNKNTGEWDFELLKEFELELLEDVGFSDTDFDIIFGDDEVFDDDFDTASALEEAKKDSRAKLGELYQLGEHFVMCGDSTKSHHVEFLMNQQKAHMLYQDPPYNIDLDYNKGISGSKNYGGDVDDAKSDTEYKAFLKSVLENAAKHCHNDAHFFSYCDQKYVGLLQNLFQELGVHYKRTCLWLKNGMNPTPNIAFGKAYEPCVYGTRGKPYLSDAHTKFSEVMNKDIEGGNRMLDDARDLFDIWLVSRLSGQDYQHPTEKPSTLHERPLKRCSKVGDVVLDFFGGSGSTLVACEALKRRAYLMEINPIFIEVILRRWEELTGRPAKLIRTFDEPKKLKITKKKTKKTDTPNQANNA